MFDLTLALIGLSFSAFFSASELAFISANPLQMEVWLKQERRGAKAASLLLGRPHGWLLTVLVGTTVANVFTASFATAYLLRAGWAPWASIAAITALILLFGEVLPKTIAGERPNQVLRITAPFNRFFGLLLSPLARLLGRFSGLSQDDDPKTAGALERDDLKVLFSRQSAAQVLQQDGQELISQVFEFGETPISKAMTPRTRIAAAPDSADLQTVAHTFIESGYSKLPIYHDNLDNIVGVVYLYDLFKEPQDLASIIKPVTRVPDSNNTIAVLRQLQQDQHSIAVVLDEFGGTAGLATMEDIFEELFGEFEDEFDDPGAAVTRAADGSLLALGRTDVEELASAGQLQVPPGDYETLAGYLMSELGRIPNAGERLTLPIGTVEIKKATPSQVLQVQIWPRKDAPKPGQGRKG